MTRHGIELDSEEIKAFCRKWKIKELSVFGSILRDDFRTDSDVDFLADFEEDEEWDLFDEIHMHEELEQIAGRKADLISRRALEFGGNKRFQKEVISTLEKVYAQ